jgi:hypothetical protein
MHLVFLTPLAALVGVAIVIPVAAVLLRERRDQRLRRALRLSTPTRRLAPALAGAAAVACLAAAAAQPAIKSKEGIRIRKDAQIYFVFDISRSMLASQRAGAPTRFERTRSFALRLRPRLAGFPVGVATLTDRTLEVIPPTAGRTLFDQVVQRVVGIDRPPPAGVAAVSTQFSTLVDLAVQRYYSRTAKHRLAIVLSDMESDYFDPRVVRNSLAALHVGLIVVRFSHDREAIYGLRGRRDPNYRPFLNNLARVETLAAASVGERLFGEHDLGAVAHAARTYLGHGPTMASAPARRTIRLGPYAVLAGALPLLFLLRRR